MRLKFTISFVVLLGIASFKCLAQSDMAEHKINIQIPEVALLGLVAESSTDVTLQTSLPNEAGETILLDEETSSQGIWINYSSIISTSTPKRKVEAFVQGEIPQGITLKVQASEFSGSGKGKLGKSSGLVTLSNQPADVIVDIGSCYTGKGANNGHYLTYKLEQNEDADVYALSEQNSSVNVVYTLTDYN